MKRRKIRTVWKDYLTLSMRERRGLTILLLILLLQIVVLFYLNTLKPEFPYPDFEKLCELSGTLESESHFPKEEFVPLKLLKLSKFNPNFIEESKWIEFGLSERQAHSVSNYLSKGGGFKVKNDVKKIYGMKESLFQKLVPFIDLPDSIHFVKKNQEPFHKQNFLLELNSADSIQLEKLRGVGFTLASRIIKYRNRLGGFNSVEQLKEVWGLNDTLFQLIRSQVKVDQNSELKRINVNRDSVTTLALHPYIGRKLAYLIFNYRNQHGPFKSKDELKVLPLLTDEIFRKLVPYLILE